MKRFLILLLLLFTSYLLLRLPAQSRLFNEQFQQDSVARHGRALLYSQIPNLSIWAVNRYLFKNDFAYIDIQSIKTNFRQQPLWDYDMFGTNVLAHPYHGSLDFTAARVNGFNYYQSIPYAFVSSLIWEYLLENEPASINDQIATTMGGVLLGEALFRISSSIYKNQSVGFERFARELLGTLVSPMHGIDRAITGQMWRVSAAPTNYKTIPITLEVGTGVRWLSQTNHNQLGGYLQFRYTYGNAMQASTTPFESFQVDATVDPFAKNSFIAHVAVTGAILSKSSSYKHSDITYGLYQHYLYMDGVANQEGGIYFRYSEPAVVGFGLLTENRKSTIRTENYLNALFLAAAHASPFKLLERDYNFGFGYGIRHLTTYTKSRWRVGIDLRTSHLFTTVGYNKETNLSEQNHKTFYTMGDKGSTWMFIGKAEVDYRIYKELSLSLKYNYIKQYTRNRDFPNFSLTSSDCYLGVTHRF